MRPFFFLMPRVRRKNYGRGRYTNRRKNTRSRRNFRANGGRAGLYRRTTKRKRISPVAYRYLLVRYNPFGYHGLQFPCLPDVKSFPSDKFYLRKRGTMTCAAVGDGTNKVSAVGSLAWIAFNPYTLSNGTADPCIYHTANSDVTTSGDLPDNIMKFTGTEDGVALAYWDSQFGSTYHDNNKFRVVAAGLRVKYAGQWDDLKGTVAVFKHDTNEEGYLFNSASGRSFSTLLDFDDTAYGAASHNTVHECLYHPKSKEDFEYINHSGTGTDGFIMAIAIDNAPQGTVPTAAPTASYDGEPWMWEAIAYYEAIGPDVHGESASGSDPQGLGNINALPNRQTIGTGPPFNWSQAMRKVARKSGTY